MRRPRFPLAYILLCLPVFAAATNAAAEIPAAPSPSSTPPTALSADRVIVEWAPGAGRAERVEARGDAGVDFVGDLGNRRFQLVEVEPGGTAGEAVRALEADPAVIVAERDGYSVPHAIPDDPLFDQLWGLQNTGAGIRGVSGAVAGADIDANGAWIRTVGAPSTVIADLDSGYRFEHPDLASVAWTNAAETDNGADDDGNGIVDDLQGADFVGPNGESPTTDGDPTDDDLLSGGHGVHTAGTMGAAGDDGTGIVGVAQDVRIMPLRVCSRFASSDDSRCPFSSQVAAINYAAAKGARVANMSLGGTSSSTTVRNAIAAADETLFVISAGNDGQDNDAVPHFPCNHNPLAEGKSTVDNVICVAATNQADDLAGFSDWGATSVDLGAPGTETLSTFSIVTPLAETFAINDFSSKWPATGADGGFQRTNESPLTSFGMTDAIGVPAADTVRETTSAAVSIPANGECSLVQTRRVVLSGTDQYRYSVLLDGVEQSFATPGSTSGAGLEKRFLVLPAAFDVGGSVQVRFRFTTGSAPAAEAGVWLDNVQLRCAGSSYAFLQGTSMAAPHVTGAAALLFSLKPSATVTEVKDALLSSVDPVPALAGKTVSGGRLNASEAIDLFDQQAPSAPQLTSTDPVSPANQNQPRIRGSTEERSSVALYAAAGCSGTPVAAGTAEELGGAGIGVTVPDNSATEFSAKATDTAGNASPCSAAISYSESTPFVPTIVEGPPDETEEAEEEAEESEELSPVETLRPTPATACTVPKAIGKTLAGAKAALTAAHCTLGKLSRPSARTRRRLNLGPLVVVASTPGAGARPADGKVDLKLGPKPKAKKRHR